MKVNMQNLKPWKPGQSGNPSGRPKRILPRIDEVLKAKSLEPLDELLKLLPDLEPRDKMKVWLEIIAYIHPKAKPVTEEEEDELDKLPTSELLKMIRQALPGLESA